MFEDRTFENIMSEMMQDMPNDINTEEGSVIYNACAKQALKLEEFYLSAAYIYDNMLPDEQDEEHFPSRFPEGRRGHGRARRDGRGHDGCRGGELHLRRYHQVGRAV